MAGNLAGQHENLTDRDSSTCHLVTMQYIRHAGDLQ